MSKIRITGPKDEQREGFNVVNTTSHEKPDSPFYGLSPFVCGPVTVEPFPGMFFESKCVENGWQYSKVYSEHLSFDKRVTSDWFEWALDGYRKARAVRYPMGKGSKPEFALHQGERLGYIEARKRIFIPLYANSVKQTTAFSNLKNTWEYLQEEGRDLWLWDFDHYDHHALGMDFRDVIHNEKQTMGHGFILAMLLEGFDLERGNL